MEKEETNSSLNKRNTEGNIKEKEESKNTRQSHNHLKDAVAAFYNYKNDALKEVKRMEEQFGFLPETHQKYIEKSYRERIERMKDCINKNFTVLCHIVADHHGLFSFRQIDGDNFEIPPLDVSHSEVLSIRSVLRHLVRDWSVKGEPEREQCYKPIIEELTKYYPDPLVDGQRIKVLLPGSGLSRLVMEFAVRGYAAQGNENSLFMLLTSEFILNKIERVNQYEIFPYTSNWCNLFKDQDAFESFKIPDVNPGEQLPLDADISIIAGDFARVYRGQIGEWDGIVTCFFLDTASNVIQYIETIHSILRSKGVWVNFGPLLYHYTEVQSRPSIELSWEDIERIILEMGFTIQQKTVKQCTYAQQKELMIGTIYNCIFFTAVKE